VEFWTGLLHSDSHCKEAGSLKVDLPDDGDTIACVLSFCYTQNYRQAGGSIDSASDEVALNHL
jgi:hypothetical protein